MGKDKTKATKSTTTQTTRTIKPTTTSKGMTTTTTTKTSSSESSITNISTSSSEDTARSQKTGMWTQAKPRTLSSTSSLITTFTALKTTQAGNTNAHDNTTLSTRTLTVTSGKTLSDERGSVVVPFVSVFVVAVIALAAAIVYLLWRRHRRLKHQKAKVVYSGTSISNSIYDANHGLDRHISLQDQPPDDSVDSGYAEISPVNLNEEDRPGNVYQTIDNLPEKKVERGNGYGHLKLQTTKFIVDSYSHVTVKQNGKPSSDATYNHTLNPKKDQELKDDGDNENAYNHLEKYTRNTQGIQQPIKQEGKNKVDDLDAEYNHAKAGQLLSEPGNDGDTYSHLNNTQTSRGIQQDD